MVFCCDILRRQPICNYIVALFLTTILTGIFFIVALHANNYPQKYQHSSQILCINCGRDMKLFGQCCTYGTVTQYDCVTYQRCKEMEEIGRQGDQEMYNIGKWLIVGGSIAFSLWVTTMILWYIKQMKRRRNVQSRIEALIMERRIEEPLLYQNRRINRSIVERKLAPIKQEIFVGDGQTCSICLMQYDKFHPHEIRQTCKHKFHLQCIKLWERKQRTCPLCRRQ